MNDVKFPLPRAHQRNTKTASITIRLKAETKERLNLVAPNARDRTAWLNESIEMLLDYVEKHMRKSGKQKP